MQHVLPTLDLAPTIPMTIVLDLLEVNNLATCGKSYASPLSSRRLGGLSLFAPSRHRALPDRNQLLPHLTKECGFNPDNGKSANDRRLHKGYIPRRFRPYSSPGVPRADAACDLAGDAKLSRQILFGRSESQFRVIDLPFGLRGIHCIAAQRRRSARCHSTPSNC